MKLYKICMGALLLAGTAACTDEDYKLYDTGQKDAVFFEYRNDNEEIATSVDYAFNYDIAEEHIVRIPVRLMGMPVERDRKVTLVADAASTDMVEGVHYRVDETVIPAGEVASEAVVHLLRNNDPALQERAFTLVLEIAENEELRAVGQKNFTLTYSDIRPTDRPGWWTTWTAIPVYSYEAAQQFFRYFYELAPAANKAVFDEMIAAYGDYFVRAGSMRGPFAMYTNFLLKYVQIPMYEDLKDEFEWQDVPSM